MGLKAWDLRLGARGLSFGTSQRINCSQLDALDSRLKSLDQSPERSGGPTLDGLEFFSFNLFKEPKAFRKTHVISQFADGSKGDSEKSQIVFLRFSCTSFNDVRRNRHGTSSHLAC